jgi:hypothetical protein
LLFTTYNRLTTVLSLLGQQRESNELLRELLATLASLGDERTRSPLLTDLQARRQLIYGPDGPVAPDAWAYYVVAAPPVADPVKEVLQIFEPVNAVLPLFEYGWTLLVQGELGEATRVLSTVVDLATETGQPSIASAACHQLAVTARILGDLEHSQTLNEQSIAINRTVPGPPSWAPCGRALPVRFSRCMRVASTKRNAGCVALSIILASVLLLPTTATAPIPGWGWWR